MSRSNLAYKSVLHFALFLPRLLLLLLLPLLPPLCPLLLLLLLRTCAFRWRCSSSSGSGDGSMQVTSMPTRPTGRAAKHLSQLA